MTNLPDDLFEIAKSNIRRSAVRLLRLLDGDTPRVIIANEIGLLLVQGVRCFEQEVFADFARRCREAFLEENSRCRHCLASSEDLIRGLCPKCATKAEKEVEDFSGGG